jgi:hypothetical protein
MASPVVHSYMAPPAAGSFNPKCQGYVGNADASFGPVAEVAFEFGLQVLFLFVPCVLGIGNRHRASGVGVASPWASRGSPPDRLVDPSASGSRRFPPGVCEGPQKLPWAKLRRWSCVLGTGPYPGVWTGSPRMRWWRRCRVCAGDMFETATQPAECRPISAPTPVERGTGGIVDAPGPGEHGLAECQKRGSRGRGMPRTAAQPAECRPISATAHVEPDTGSLVDAPLPRSVFSRSLWCSGR